VNGIHAFNGLDAAIAFIPPFHDFRGDESGVIVAFLGTVPKFTGFIQ
jgi:hypothetical protein